MLLMTRPSSGNPFLNFFMLTKLIFFLILFSSSLISKSVGFLSRLSFSRDASTATVTDIREHLQHILRCVVCGSVVKNSIQHVWYHFIISSRNVLFHIGDFVVEPLSGCQIFFLHSTLDKERHSHLFFLFPTFAFFKYTQNVGNLASFLTCNLQNLLQVTPYLPLQLVSLFCRI